MHKKGVFWPRLAPCLTGSRFAVCPGEMTSTNVELVRVTNEGKVVHFSKEEVQDYLDEAE